MNNYDCLFKICLIGDSGVGKTSLAKKYIDDIFQENSSAATIGMDFHMTTKNLYDKDIKLQIWDVSGDHRFKYILEMYCKNCQGIVLMFDVSKYCSFANLTYWLKYIYKYIPNDFPKIIVGCKVDLKREISYEEAFSFAQDRNIEYLETSTKLGKNIENAFAKIIYEIKSNRKYSLRYLNSYTNEDEIGEIENISNRKNKNRSCNWFACCNNDFNDVTKNSCSIS